MTITMEPTLTIASIRVSGLNPRKTFDDDAMTELRTSIRENGLAQPIAVRPLTLEELSLEEVDQGIRFELIAGERRLRAFILNDELAIPAMVHEVSREQAIELRLAENLNREDLTAFEESDAYNQLLDSAGWSLERIIAKTGKAAKYVYDRIALKGLAPSIRQTLIEREWPLSHALALAKLDPEAQTTLCEEGRGNIGIPRYRTLIDTIRRISYSLEKAPFAIEDENLIPVMGACSQCPFNTATHALLFPEFDDDGATCLKPSCYMEKSAIRFKRTAENAGITTFISAWGSCDLRQTLEDEGFTVIEQYEVNILGEDQKGGDFAVVLGDIGSIKLGSIIKFKEISAGSDSDEDSRANRKEELHEQRVESLSRYKLLQAIESTALDPTAGNLLNLFKIATAKFLFSQIQMSRKLPFDLQNARQIVESQLGLEYPDSSNETKVLLAMLGLDIQECMILCARAFAIGEVPYNDNSRGPNPGLLAFAELLGLSPEIARSEAESELESKKPRQKKAAEPAPEEATPPATPEPTTKTRVRKPSAVEIPEPTPDPIPEPDKKPRKPRVKKGESK